MVEGATWDEWDIPWCPTTATKPPKGLIPYWEAKTIHKREMRRGNTSYHINAFVHTYGDDQKFDGARSGMWQKPEEAIEIISHFDGLITPDASTYADFPDPLKRYNTYRMRAFGYYAGGHGIALPNFELVRGLSFDKYDGWGLTSAPKGCLGSFRLSALRYLAGRHSILCLPARHYRSCWSTNPLLRRVAVTPRQPARCSTSASRTPMPASSAGSGRSRTSSARRCGWRCLPARWRTGPSGTASALAEAVGVAGVSPAALGKRIAQHSGFLGERGVSVTREHTRTGNVITLTRAGGDGREGTPATPPLPSQPSQPSPLTLAAPPEQQLLPGF